MNFSIHAEMEQEWERGRHYGGKATMIIELKEKEDNVSVIQGKDASKEKTGKHYNPKNKENGAYSRKRQKQRLRAMVINEKAVS